MGDDGGGGVKNYEKLQRDVIYRWPLKHQMHGDTIEVHKDGHKRRFL